MGSEGKQFRSIQPPTQWRVDLQMARALDQGDCLLYSVLTSKKKNRMLWYFDLAAAGAGTVAASGPSFDMVFDFPRSFAGSANEVN